MKVAGIVLLVFLLSGLGWYFYPRSDLRDRVNPPIEPTTSEKVTQVGNPSSADSPQTTIIATGLDTPWTIAFLPDGGMLVTERAGRVRLVDKDGKLQSEPIATISGTRESGEGGLLGIAIHPEFEKNGYVYLYYTYSESGNNTLNRVVRMTYKDKKLADEKIIVDAIPGASNHDGGRIKFGPDKMLYIGTGDAGEPSLSQDANSLAGKILRVTENGEAPSSGNPFNSRLFSFGHRNVQGLTWDSSGVLWSTEHGRSGLQSGFDELNLIKAGNNYGWPDIEGDETSPGITIPKKHSGATNTWAPSGASFYNGSVYFGGLRGQALYQAVIKDNEVVDFKEHLKGKFGRIRDVVLGPDNMLYVTTSNHDGRGIPSKEDDRIIRVNPTKL